MTQFPEHPSDQSRGQTPEEFALGHAAFLATDPSLGQQPPEESASTEPRDEQAATAPEQSDASAAQHSPIDAAERLRRKHLADLIRNAHNRKIF